MSHGISFTSSRAGAQGQRRGAQSHPGQGQGSSTGVTPQSGHSERGHRGLSLLWAPCRAVRRRCWLGLSSAERRAQVSVTLRATHVMARQHPDHGEVALEKVTWLGSASGGANGSCRMSSALGAEQGALRAQREAELALLWECHR